MEMRVQAMGRVIALETKKNVDQDLVALLEEMLASARRGEARGIAGMLDMASGKQRVFSRGTFADDEHRTVRIASTALDTLCQRTGIPHPKVNTTCPLPPRLTRKA